ncbi:MAG TPA: hypothetical protein VED46_02260 [Alphaproteobacteria bacterium]|nr:hypothetical protein [Alphaproteobacteria bacterium]
MRGRDPNGVVTRADRGAARPQLWLCAVAMCLICARPGAALAHALPDRYELPIPLDLYLGAAGLAVGFSFVLLAACLRARPQDYPRIDLSRIPVFRLCSALLRGILRAIGLGAFLLVLVAGLFGDQRGLRNIAPVLIWVIWWVGLAFLCALIGNAWRHLNPWRTLFDIVEGIRALSPRLSYPLWLGSWPAVGFFLIFAWMELVWVGAERPRDLALAILLYSAVTLAGMAVYGRDAWLGKAEAFSVFFATLGRFAPLSAGGSDPDPPGTLRSYALGLTQERPLPASRLAFVMLMLALVTFDGLLETPLWSELSEALRNRSVMSAPWQALVRAGVDPNAVLMTVGLLATPMIFFAAYWLICAIAAWAVGKGRAPGQRRWTAWELARIFVLSLVPIAIAYHFAHYLSYLLLAGQFAIPLASDPFGFGWNLFGTKLYRFDIGIIDARSVWIVCLTAIVLGHVAAVYLAHRTAILLFGEGRLALASQVPMVALMIGYTMSSLWILAQPIVTSPKPG